LILAELHCGPRPQSGAPSVSKFGNLSMREILVVPSVYACPYARPYRLWERGGEGSPKATQLEGECHLLKKRFL